MKNKKILPILSALVAVIFLVGLFTFATACPVPAEGKPMKCHWSEMALKGIAVIMIIMPIIRIAISNISMARGIAIGELLVSLLGLAVVTFLIGTCMKADMHCNTNMRPFTLLIFVIYVILSGAYLFTTRDSVEKVI